MTPVSLPMLRKYRLAVTLLVLSALTAIGTVGCGQGGGPSDYYSYRSSTDSVRVAYEPGPPAHVFDSSAVVLALKPLAPLGTDSLALELMPARSGWCLPIDSFLVLDSTGWYRARVWMRPTNPGAYVVRWQTNPFTGFTYYFVAEYDSSGRLASVNNQIDTTFVDPPLLVRDTMELVFTYWPHVWYRRVHFVRRADQPRTFYVITQELQRTAGVSGRTLRPTANLKLDPAFPVRTRRWNQGGWVVDTLSVWVRDTLVAAIDWSYNEWVNNWEKNYTLFRDWQHEHHPDIYFKVDTLGHLAKVWIRRPAGEYICAKMTIIESQPDFETVKTAFIRGEPSPTGESP